MNNNLVDAKGWRSVLNQIGAKKAEIGLLDKATQKIFESFTSGGGVNWSDFRKLRKTLRSEYPFIDVDGRPFVLFIYDQSGVGYHSGWKQEYKYHFCWCHALKMMSSSGRRGRYKAKYDIDNNIFTVNRGYGDSQIEMNVCKFCLGQMDFGGYAKAKQVKKNKIYDEFNIAYFFSLNLPQDLLKPTHPFHTGRYTEDWHQVSKNIRRDRGNKCEECGSSKHLQVHHINGVKDDNRYSNLKVLCYEHHADQPFHQHMKNKI